MENQTKRTFRNKVKKFRIERKAQNLCAKRTSIYTGCKKIPYTNFEGL